MPDPADGEKLPETVHPDASATFPPTVQPDQTVHPPAVHAEAPTAFADTLRSEHLASAPAAPPPVSLPGYEVLEELGRGGMGVVYKARQKGLNRFVALKMVLSGPHASPGEMSRFRTEAETLARLRHANIVQVYEIDEHEGRPFFSMEYVEGGNLAELRGAPQPLREAAALVETVSRAVHAAHQAGIVHRDLKPANILLARNDPLQRVTAGCAEAGHYEPKITDFGLAKHLDANLQRTRSGDVLGTPNYMAPEQAAGKVALIGPATDIHALGAILYELLTGRPPFERPTLMATLEQVCKEHPEPPRRKGESVPRDLEVICLKCLRKRPEDRYASAEDLADDLRRFLDGEPIQARPAPLSVRVVRWLRRGPLRPVPLIALLLLAAVGVTAAVLLLNRPRPREYTDEEIREAAAECRRALFRDINTSRTREGWIRNDLSKEDDSEPWSHTQAVCALLACPDATRQELREAAAAVDVLYRNVPRLKKGSVHYGWPPRPGDTYAQAEPMLWAAGAVALALGRPGLLTDEERRRFEGYLAETHEALRPYAPDKPDGAWRIVAHPTDVKVFNTYVNALALSMLLETRRAGLPWDGSVARRDELLATTVRWLASRFDATADSPGWYKDTGSRDQILEGLTLQIYAGLLRADTEAGLPLPNAIRPHIVPHLLRCADRPLEFPNMSAYFSYPFTTHDGRASSLRQNFTLLWYPWAVEACVRWLEYSERHDVLALEKTEVKRVLGRLVVDLKDKVATVGESYIYIRSERLYGLSSVK